MNGHSLHSHSHFMHDISEPHIHTSFTYNYMYMYMQNKEGSIPHEDLGKSIATVQVLQRKHETFERELAAMGNKVCQTNVP